MLVGPEQQRRELLADLHGRVLELGAGEGRNFALYPATVQEVIAVEPEPYLRQHAVRAAQAAEVPVTVLDGSADELPVAVGSCDAAVASLVLCTVPDQARALAALREVLVPSGELRFYEHVLADHAVTARLQRLLDHTGAWPRLGAGCHLARDTQAAIEQAGFRIEAIQRSSFGPGPFGVPFILGRARRGTSDGEVGQ
ncbi:MAG TPA: class I SAM-dependent methyltransferase [Solirubrobacteraceae bacterium]|nr:class I SAM-dependent methyltransferase [Solirubrobacteraceae bacterium]